MNRALTYLWLSLLKRRGRHFCRGLLRPTSLLGFIALVSLFSFGFYYRRAEAFFHLVRPAALMGGALVMLGGSVFRGFNQRGLVFEPPDLEFLFTSPFSQCQIVVYRLLPNYLFALVQGLVFVALLAPHLEHPLLTTLCFICFQIICFHIATAAAIFAGTISETLHYRLRWMLLGTFFVVTGIYLRAAWDLRLIPSFVASPLTQFFFYPAVTLSDFGTGPLVAACATRLFSSHAHLGHPLWSSACYLGSFGLATAASLWWLLRFKGNIFETALAATTRVAERRRRIQQGRVVAREPARLSSVRLPGLGVFGGIGAMVWKNLVMARRSRRELLLTVVFTMVYSAPLCALLWAYHRFMSNGVVMPEKDTLGVHSGVALMFASLPFLLQRTLPFDFRRDGPHLLEIRTLPVSPLALVLAELAVPTALCLVFQAFGVAWLFLVARIDGLTVLLCLLAFPAATLAINGVWNLHYLLSATKRAGVEGVQAPSAVGTLTVVALSFLIFFPASWIAGKIGQFCDPKQGVPLAMAGGLATQYLVDLLLILILAKLFQRFEVSRDA
jgi:Putative ABC exporter